MRSTPDFPTICYWLAIALAVAASLCLVGTGAGVGIIGADGDPANLMYGATLLTIIIGAPLVRFRATGMARTMVAAALSQVLITALALVQGLGQPFSPPLELIGVNGGFVVMWLGAAWLFRRAARARTQELTASVRPMAND